MRKCKKILFLFILLVCIVAGLMGCGKQKKDTSNKVKDVVETETQDTEIIDERYINLLTGEVTLTEQAIGKRPVAVMVNNVKAAFPQYGIEAADVIFEIPVEGRATRFMAMYGDYTQVPKICSIRSCRKYFPALSEGFDAIYVNWGMMDEVRAYTKTLKLTQFDGKYNDGKLFGRDKERRAAGYALEHTGYFDGTRVDDVLIEKGLRTDIEEDKRDPAFHFVALNEKVTPTGGSCTKVEVDFGIALATLTYNAENGKYWKDYNGEPQIDGKTGNQLSFTNVLVLEAQIKGAANGIHRDVNWHGGQGYYVSNGAVQKITWSKDTEQSRLMLYDENGNDLVINRGKSYIAVNYIGDATFE